MKRSELLLLLTSTCLLVFAWIGFSIYHNSVTSTIPETLSIQIRPITPAFDRSTIQNLKARTRVAPKMQLEERTESLATPASTPTGSRLTPIKSGSPAILRKLPSDVSEKQATSSGVPNQAPL